MAQWVTDIMGKSAPRVVSVTSRGGRGPSAASQEKAYQARIKRENEAKLKQYQDQMTADNDAAIGKQDEQYENLLGTIAGLRTNVTGEDGTYDQMQELMEMMGTTGSARIGQNRDKQLAANTQSNISRGLGNTTIQNTTERGIMSDAEFNQQALDEQVALAKSGVLGQKAGAQQNIERLMADSILSRQYQQPNQDMYARLISQMFSA